MIIRRFVLKVINNVRKILTHHEIIDGIAEKIVSVITQFYKESKIGIHSNRELICVVDLRTLKKDFFKENNKPFTAIETTTKH